MIHMRAFNKFELDNLAYLTSQSIEYTLVQITATGYKKTILDATEPMRQYFKDRGMHDYSTQLQGTENKIFIRTTILDELNAVSTTSSLYRPTTKKGDPRIWTYKIKDFCNPDDILMMIYRADMLYVVNISKIDIHSVCTSPIVSPLKDLIGFSKDEELSTATELIGLLKDMSLEWHPAEVLADTGIGRAVESLLGISMNSSKLPDYKGIELKSARDKRPGIRSTLFCQVPDWSKSNFKSAKEIVEKYGYIRDNSGKKMYQNTVKTTCVNSQNLTLTLYQIEEILAIEEKRQKTTQKGNISISKVRDVALWELPVLHKRLLEKHHETFWIDVETKKENDMEYFRPISIDHTKNPIVSQFDNLLDTGYISVDLLLGRLGKGGDTVSFKMAKKARPLLFPQNELIMLK